MSCPRSPTSLRRIPSFRQRWRLWLRSPRRSGLHRCSRPHRTQNPSTPRCCQSHSTLPPRRHLSRPSRHHHRRHRGSRSWLPESNLRPSCLLCRLSRRRPGLRLSGPRGRRWNRCSSLDGPRCQSREPARAPRLRAARPDRFGARSGAWRRPRVVQILRRAHRPPPSTPPSTSPGSRRPNGPLRASYDDDAPRRG